MQKVYSNENQPIVVHAKNLLENAGIEVQIKNEFVGANLSHISQMELWVSENDFEKATQIVNTKPEQGQQAWVCQNCNETNEGNFNVCWKCQNSVASD